MAASLADTAHMSDETDKRGDDLSAQLAAIVRRKDAYK